MLATHVFLLHCRRRAASYAAFFGFAASPAVCVIVISIFFICAYFQIFAATITLRFLAIRFLLRCPPLLFFYAYCAAF